MKRRMHFKWQLGRAYFYPPWHDGLPTFRDWLALLFGLLVMAFAFKRYIQLGEQAGWEVAVAALAAEAWKEIREAWHG
jgi:hypothetical protein